MTEPAANILHADLDAFYASVEQLRNPSLRDKAMAVGGGVILAASYEARAFGVRSAMPVRRALSLCPHLIIVEGHFEDYTTLSRQVFEICDRYTPLVEQISIDEAFLDVSGSVHLFGPAPQIAASLRAAVLDEVGLVMSIGVARTKFLAKVASQVAKPDGMLVVEPDAETDFLHPLPVKALWGVGPATEAKLARLGIVTVGDIAVTEERVLTTHLGHGAGSHLHALAWNRDPRPVVTSRRAKSIGAQSSFGSGGLDPDRRRRILLDLAERVGTRLRRKDRAARTITVRVRFQDLEAVTRSATLKAPIATTEAIAAVAVQLATLAIDEAAAGRDVNLVGISTGNLVESPHLQLELPMAIDPQTDGDETGSGRGAGSDTGEIRTGSMSERSRHELESAIDTLRERFGRDAVSRASLLGEGAPSLVPDEFRDIATKD